jgi:hypothetical protein
LRVSPYDAALLPSVSPVYGPPADLPTTRDPPPFLNSSDLPEVHIHELEDAEDQTDGPIIITVNSIA